MSSIFSERKNMAQSLKDTDSIVRSLEFGLGAVMHFIFSALYLYIWGVDILKGFSTFSTTVLALTFVFGNSVRNVYEAMLFLFVEHAFDVGDLLLLDNENMRVKKIDLMYTVLVKGATGAQCTSMYNVPHVHRAGQGGHRCAMAAACVAWLPHEMYGASCVVSDLCCCHPVAMNARLQPSHNDCHPDTSMPSTQPTHPPNLIPNLTPPPLSGEVLHYPNTKLLTVPIINVTRSNSRGDGVKFLLDVGTPIDKLKEVRGEEGLAR